MAFVDLRKVYVSIPSSKPSKGKAKIQKQLIKRSKSYTKKIECHYNWNENHTKIQYNKRTFIGTMFEILITQ